MKVIRVRTDEGNRIGLLIGTGHKFHKVILIDNPIRMVKFPLDHDKYFTDLLYKGELYPVPRFLKHLKRLINRWHQGINHVSKPVQEALKPLNVSSERQRESKS